MARTRAAQPQPQDASQEPREGETPLEQGEAREVNEANAQLTGAEGLLNVEHARVPGDLIQATDWLMEVKMLWGWLMVGEALVFHMKQALPAPVDNFQ
jgi:hypothetical protein